MNFLLDESFPKAALPVLRKRQHTLWDARDHLKRGAPDSDVKKLAWKKKAIILTTDRDFFHTLGRKLDSHYGVIVVALRQPTRRNILERLEWLLDHISETEIPNRVFQLRDQTWVCYPPIEG